jgi:hypothetical protein
VLALCMRRRPLRFQKAVHSRNLNNDFIVEEKSYGSATKKKKAKKKKKKTKIPRAKGTMLREPWRSFSDQQPKIYS